MRPTKLINDVRLPGHPPDKRWDIRLSDGHITSITPFEKPDLRKEYWPGNGCFLAPSLCHPHVHLDKAFLLSHPKYADLQIEKGTFSEAMDITNKAKAMFERKDLLERGRRLVNESGRAGVTHMRAFVEVDPIVGLKCLEVGREIKQDYSDVSQSELCDVQICAFAQLPLFSGDDNGEETRRLMTEATKDEYMAEAVGSTPYVESDRNKMQRNVEWLVDLALEHDKHIDFHLDYNLDPDIPPLIWDAIKTLKEKQWTQRSKKTIVFGHCTRLSLFKEGEWKRLAQEIGDLPISFVGLPTSDLYMMTSEHGARGTLNILNMIKNYGFNAAIGINNIGNAFTPQGSCDPLFIANLGVGLYQAGTVQDAELLYECISTRARAAIGMAQDRMNDRQEEARFTLQAEPGQKAHCLMFNWFLPKWTSRRSIEDAVYFYDGGQNRAALLGGRETYVEPEI